MSVYATVRLCQIAWENKLNSLSSALFIWTLSLPKSSDIMEILYLFIYLFNQLNVCCITGSVYNEGQSHASQIPCLGASTNHYPSRHHTTFKAR